MPTASAHARGTAKGAYGMWLGVSGGLRASAQRGVIPLLWPLLVVRLTRSAFSAYRDEALARQPLQMRRKARDVVSHRTARGRFDEIALEIVIGTLADDIGQRR